MIIIKNGKRQMTKEVERPNQEKIKTLGEKETYKYFRIFEVDIVKQVEKKGKIKKSTSRERENYSKSNYIAETSSKG